MARSFLRSTIYQMWLLVALLIILFAFYLALGRQFMPAIDHYREDIQRFVSAQWGVETRLGRLHGSWEGYEPSLVLEDLQVFLVGSSGDVPAFTIAQLTVTLDSLRSILAREVVFRNVVLSGLRLHLRQTETGWDLPGMTVMTADQPPGAGPEGPVRWLLAQAHAKVTDTSVSVQPLGQEPVRFSHVNLSIFNRGVNHRVRGRLRLEGEVGRIALELRAEGEGDPFDQAGFFADFYLKASDAVLEQPLFREQLPILHIARLQGDAEFWGYWREGRVDYLIGDLRLPRSTWVAGGDRLQIPIADAGGRLVWRATANDRWSAELSDIRFAWEDHQSHISRIRVASAPEDRSLRLTSDRLALGPFNRFLLGTGVLPENLSAILSDLSPSGDLANIQGTYWLDPAAPRRFLLRANLRDVGVSAWGQAPALSRIDGYLEADERRGHIDLDTADTLLEFPMLYQAGWQLARVRGRVGWSVDLPKVQVRSGLLRLAPPGADLRARFNLWLPLDGTDPEMSLAVGIARADGSHTKSFLPARIMPAAVTDWLVGAVEKGSVLSGAYLYHGRLKNRTEQNFSSIMYFDVDQGRLRFLPDWPAIGGIRALVVGDARAYHAEVSAGRLLDSQVHSAKVIFPRSGPARIRVQADVRHELPAVVRLLRETPLREMTPALLETWQAQGTAPTRLNLQVALGDETRVQARADVRLNGARLVIPQGPKPMEFSRIRGRVRWSSAKGLSSEGLRTRFLGANGRVEIETGPGEGGGTETRVQLISSVEMPRLLQLIDSPILSFASGTLPYQAELRVPYSGEMPLLDIHSSLQGVSIDMPPPLKKPAGTTLDTSLRLRLGEVEDRIHLHMAGLMRGRIYQKNGLVSRGILSFGDEEIREMPLDGLKLGGRLPRLDFAEWQAFLPELNRRMAGAVEGGSTSGLVRTMEFRFGELLLFGYTMPDSHVQLVRMPAHWNLDLRNDFLSLDAKLPHDERAPLDLYLEYLRLPAPEAATSGDPLREIDPRDIPPLDVRIDEFRLGEEALGSWTFRSRPVASGLSVTGIQGQMRATRFQQGKLDWGFDEEGHKTAGSVVARAGDMADVLKAWGFEPSIESEKAKFVASLAWPASPAAFDLARAEGSMRAKIERGRFIEAQGAGILRVFGILNINTIARRLRLDFSDLFKKGLSYDRIEGEYRLRKGVLSSVGTIDIIGPGNKFYISGDVDLLNETLNQKMTLTLPLTSNLPFAALIAGAPYLAGAIYLTEKLLGDKLERFASAQYSIRGPWADPEVKLEKVFTDKD